MNDELFRGVMNDELFKEMLTQCDLTKDELIDFVQCSREEQERVLARKIGEQVDIGKSQDPESNTHRGTEETRKYVTTHRKRQNTSALKSRRMKRADHSKDADRNYAQQTDNRSRVKEKTNSRIKDQGARTETANEPEYSELQAKDFLWALPILIMAVVLIGLKLYPEFDIDTPLTDSNNLRRAGDMFTHYGKVISEYVAYAIGAFVILSVVFGLIWSCAYITGSLVKSAFKPAKSKDNFLDSETIGHLLKGFIGVSMIDGG